MNFYGIWAIYSFELARLRRTMLQSIAIKIQLAFN